MKTLVTGAAGFCGMHVARRLLEGGDEVVGLDNLNDYYDPQLKRDRDITRAIAAHSRRCLGVYGNVVKPGRIAEGDVLTLEPPARPVTESGTGKVKRAVMRAVAAAIPNGRN